MKFKPTIQFSIIQGLFWGSYSSIFAFSSVYLLAHGLSNSQVGYVIALGSILSAVLQPMVGAYADKSKNLILHKLMILFSMIMLVISGVLLSFGKVFWIVALFYGLLVTFLQIITPLTYALGMFFIEKGVPINFGICRGIGSLAYALVSTVLGILVEKYDTNTVIYSVILIYALLICAIIRFHFKGIEETKRYISGKTEEKGNTFFDFFRSHKRFFLVLLGNILVFINHNIIGNYMFQIVSYHGYGSKEMGFAVSLAAAFELPTLFLLSAINKKFNSGGLLKVSAIFIFLKSLCIFFAKNLMVIYLSMGFQMLGYGLFAGISIYYVSHTVEAENQVRGQAMMTMTVTMGAVLGSVLGGMLLDRASVPVVLLLASAVAAIGAGIICIFAEKGEKQK